MRLIKKNIRKGTNPGGDGMRFIGITGGVGAGKSAILAHLASKPGIRVMLADEIAHDLMQPGTECFQKLKEKFAGEDIYQPDGSLDRAQLAAVIFSDWYTRIYDVRNSHHNLINLFIKFLFRSL